MSTIRVTKASVEDGNIVPLPHRRLHCIHPLGCGERTTSPRNGKSPAGRAGLLVCASVQPAALTNELHGQTWTETGFAAVRRIELPARGLAQNIGKRRARSKGWRCAEGPISPRGHGGSARAVTQGGSAESGPATQGRWASPSPSVRGVSRAPRKATPA
jgi:hypothetical protein